MEPRQTQVKRRPGRLMAAALLLTAVFGATRASAAPRVLIISIDGCRPDVALRADMPNLRAMMARGCFTFYATTTPAAITLPSHTSMLTGVVIERHGVTANDDDSATKDDAIKVPTIFDLAKAAGIDSGMASGKSKFAIYAKSVDHAWAPEPRATTTRDAKGDTKTLRKAVAATDDITIDHAIEILEKHKPHLMFVHFGRNDAVGHSKGWGTKDQLDALAVTDIQLGRMFRTLDATGVAGETTVILSADHGGYNKTHGKDNDPSKFIPWIICGPGIRQNFDLTMLRNRPIRTYDTFATACHVLGITMPPDIDGSPVLQVFEEVELVKTAPTTDPTTVPATLPKEKF